jgi:hypothetical protein
MPNFDIPAPTTATPLPSFLLFFMLPPHYLFSLVGREIAAAF